jgi:hypothetical protein
MLLTRSVGRYGRNCRCVGRGSASILIPFGISKFLLRNLSKLPIGALVDEEGGYQLSSVQSEMTFIRRLTGGQGTETSPSNSHTIPEPERYSKPPRYITFVRIGSGLSLEDYEWINDRKWVEFDKSKPLTWLKVARTSSSEDKGDVYILPQE